MRYRKKPVEISACQIKENPEHWEIEPDIIKGVEGELYFCKPDIFDLTYETADTI